MVAADPTITLSPFVLTAGGVISSVALAWGVMSATLKAVMKEVQTVRHDLRNYQQAQQTYLIDTHERLARIEGKLGV